MGGLTLCERLDYCCDCRTKRWFLIIAAVIELICFGGYHYGYNSLIGPYLNISVFQSVCKPPGPPCDLQVDMFKYASIVWVVLQMCLFTGAGIIMDRLGLRLLKIIAILFYFVGTLMFAFSKGNAGWMLFPAGVLVALGSTASLICNHQISSMFPRFQGFAISLMSGAFDSSTVVTYIVVKALPWISLQQSFLIVAFGGLIYGLLMSIFGMTQWSVSMGKKYLPENPVTTKANEEEIEAINIDSRIKFILETQFSSLRKCIFSSPFFLVTLWFMFGLLQFSYFFTRMMQQMDYWFDGNKETINKLLPISSILLMGGFLVAPLTGLILDTSRVICRRKMEKLLQRSQPGRDIDLDLYWLLLCGIAPAFLVMAVASLIVCAVGFAKGEGAFYVAFLLFVVLRSLLFSSSISFILIAFPVQHFGAIAGIMNTIGGILSLAQYGLAQLSIIPANWVAVSISLLLFISPMIILLHRCLPCIRRS